MGQPDEMRTGWATRDLGKVARNTVRRSVSCPSEGDIFEFVDDAFILGVVTGIQDDVSWNVFLSEARDYPKADLSAWAHY